MNEEIKIIDVLKFISEQYSATIEINQDGCKTILELITNLQEEINKLTSESTEWESKCYDLQKEIKGLKENKLTPDELVNLLNQELIKQRDDYKSRIDKAIEYIKKDERLSVDSYYNFKDLCE